MSKTNVVTSISINDLYYSSGVLIRNRVWSFGICEFHIEDLVATIGLKPSTARTNVILRGADGKFISYKKASPSDIGSAVGALKPFPTN